MLKKRWLVSLFLLWILAVGQLAQGHEQEEEKVAGVFARIGEQEQTGAVEYYGVYKKEFLESEDQEKFLRRAGLLRCVQELSHHFPDLFIILIVVAQVVKELAGENAAKYGHGVPFRGAVLGGQAHAPQPLGGGVLERTVWPLIFVHVVVTSPRV